MPWAGLGKSILPKKRLRVAKLDLRCGRNSGNDKPIRPTFPERPKPRGGDCAKTQNTPAKREPGSLGSIDDYAKTLQYGRPSTSDAELALQPWVPALGFSARVTVMSGLTLPCVRWMKWALQPRGRMALHLSALPKQQLRKDRSPRDVRPIFYLQENHRKRRPRDVRRPESPGAKHRKLMQTKLSRSPVQRSCSQKSTLGAGNGPCRKTRAHPEGLLG
ncbi:uncharacterized protein LOC142564617 isoform X5 [Dermacentor variabilis]|uniref:uncharacterized protein LOC142564617 isoform X5 n=1 Tax=Dermacentor variabilis TaxID=34621 RepID=UPI003F5B525C